MIDRAEVLDALTQHRAYLTPMELPALQEMRRNVLLLEHPFTHTQLPAHFTGSALIVDPKGERVCLVHHAKLGCWIQPGGHPEPCDASLAATAVREGQEETGLVLAADVEPLLLDVEKGYFPEQPDTPQHWHYDVRFLVVAQDANALRCSDESNDVRWFNWDGAVQLTYTRGDQPGGTELRRLLAKAATVVQPTPCKTRR